MKLVTHNLIIKAIENGRVNLNIKLLIRFGIQTRDNTDFSVSFLNYCFNPICGIYTL